MPKNGDSAFLIARSIFESDIWEGDPHLLKLWIYLLGKAKFKKNSSECGILGTSVRQIKEENIYGSGLVKKRWGHKKILRMLKILESQKRIEIRRTQKGTLVKILKYEEYQTFSSYRGTLKRTQGERKGNTLERANEAIPEEVAKEMDKLITLYKEKFVGHIKRWGMNTVIRMRNLIEGTYLDNIPIEAIKERIEEAKTGTPWEILSDKWIREYKKEEEERERLRKHYSGEGR